MGKRAVLTLVIACVMGFGGFGILAADAANPVFNAVVNPLSQLPASAVARGDDVHVVQFLRRGRF